MKERPIIFNTPMVQAILDGRKTQTRRVVRYKAYANHDNPVYPHECPHGIPGDRLWVRETWFDVANLEGEPATYRATADHIATRMIEMGSGWKPSIFMPRWASRINLEITDIRVERVQEISEDDATAEGATINMGFPTSRCWFRCTWDSLNAKRSYGWDVNPWVWVISFRRIEEC